MTAIETICFASFQNNPRRYIDKMRPTVAIRCIVQYYAISQHIKYLIQESAEYEAAKQQAVLTSTTRYELT